MQRQAIKNMTAATCGAVVLFFLFRFAQTLVLNFLKGNLLTIWPDRIFLKVVPNYEFVFSIHLPVFAIYLINAAVVALVAYLFVSRARRQLILPFTLIIAGAASNLWERFAQGYVVDYINIRLFGLQGVWNLADFCILFGIFIWFFAKENP